jgi:hypothetical protein
MTAASMTAPTLTDCVQMHPESAIRAVYIRSLLLLALLAAVALIDVLAPRPDWTPSPASSAVAGAAGQGLR